MSKEMSRFKQVTKEGFYEVLQGTDFRKNEYWKNSDLSFLKTFPLENFSSPKKMAWAEIEKMVKLEFKDFHPLVFVNGCLVEELLSFGGDGVSVKHFKGDGEDVFADVHRDFKEDEKVKNFFLNYNFSFFQEGVSVELAKNYVLEKPILLLSLISETKEAASNNAVMLNLAEGAKLKIIEVHPNHSGEHSLLKNKAFFLNLKKGAQVKHFTMQDESEKNYHINFTKVSLLEQAEYKSYVFQQGAKLGVSQKKISFLAEGGKVSLNGLFLAQGEQNLDHNLEVEHRIGNCVSEQNYLGLIKGNSKAGFTGKVKVYKNAQKTDSSQLNKVIVLDKTALMKTRPQLEIYADDVKCGHGATVGKLDDENVFYLMSRGITRNEATKTLANAFAIQFSNDLKQDFPELGEWFENELLNSNFWDDKR